MVKVKVIEEKPIHIAEVKDILDKSKKREEQLNFRANLCHDYVNTFSKLSHKQADDLAEKLGKLDIPRFREAHCMKIVDLLPTTVEHVKSILQAYTLSVSTENCKKIVDIVVDYVKK